MEEIKEAFNKVDLNVSLFHSSYNFEKNTILKY